MHRANFDPNEIQISSLLSIKTGSCSEDCGYCPQSARYDSDLNPEALLPVDAVIRAAEAAREQGASRFCMGAAWRSPKDRDIERVVQMVQGVKALGMETCVTLGMLTDSQTQALKDGGLDYYNHNLDTSPEYYKKIITTRTYQDRLDTLEHVRNADIKVCCGGIVGMGETREDRIAFLQQLANLPKHPDSVTLNQLMPMRGTPLEKAQPLESFEYARVVATARILMPKAYIRLSAGRNTMNQELQALCLLAGGNSIFYGEKLLTAENPSVAEDKSLLASLGMITEESCMR